MNAEPLLDFLRRAEELRNARYPDMFFRGRRSGTPLILRSLEGPANWIRLRTGPGSPLELERVEVRDASIPDAPLEKPDSLSWSSLAPGFEAAAQAGTVFRRNGYGPGIATRPGQAEWIAFRLSRTLSRVDLVLSVRDDRRSNRAWALSVEFSEDGQTWRRAYRHLDKLIAYQDEVLLLMPPPQSPGSEDAALRILGQIVQKIVQGNYGACRALLEEGDIPDPIRRQVKATLNGGLLAAVRREWTSHGIQMSFRYWTAAEKTRYLQAASGVIAALRELTPHVCFGFGFVLGIMRSGEFIPHDDDIDLIVAWPHQHGARLAELLATVREHLVAKGYIVTGEHFNHVHVERPKWPHVFDVFVGFTEGERVSWFPSARRGLGVDSVFPPHDVLVHGVPCPFPAQPEAYLESTYGSAWREPDSHFMHPWDLAEYKDLA